jgi:hypothetical protein
LLTGQLGQPVIVSEQMKLAQASGLVHNPAANNTSGRVLLVNRTQWRVGFKREMTIETERDIQKRQNIMVVSFRLAFAERTNARTSADHTALSYNITGVS